MLALQEYQRRLMECCSCSRSMPVRGNLLLWSSEPCCSSTFSMAQRLAYIIAWVLVCGLIQAFSFIRIMFLAVRGQIMFTKTVRRFAWGWL